MKSTLHRRFFKKLLLVFLIFANSVVIARDLSEVVLSKEDQENYYDYQVDVFLQIEGYGDQELKTKYPDLVKSNAESLKKFMQSLDIINHSEFPGLEKNNKESISAYMRNAEVIDHHNDIKEAMVGRYLEDFSLNTFEEEQVAVYPTVHIKSDLAVNESLVVDYPLIVEGDLIVKGNLLIKNATPILVLGDVFVSNDFLYDIPTDGQESYLYIKGKLEVEGDAFVYGTIVAEKVSAKNIFSLSTSSYLSDGLIPFPNSPLLVKPSILPWSDEVDSDVLFHYLKRDIEPFTKPYEKTPETKPWEFFINSWSGISSNYYYNPEIAGLKYVTIDVDELSNEGKQQLEKLDGYELAHADVRTAQGFCTDNNVLKLDETSDSAFLFDSAAFKRKLAQTAEVAIYGDLKLEEYTSSCALRSRYDSFNSMFRGRLSSSYASPYGDYTEDDYSQAYQRDKNFLSVDPYLSTYWLLRFGIVFDDRYDEVEKLSAQIDHPLINSARSFFNEKAYEHSVGSYTGRVFSSFEKHVTVSDLLEGKYKAIETGSEAFKRFHSDYIYHYYKNNNIRTESTVKALAYALENNSSELSLEKAMLLIEAINGNELIQSVEQPISTTNSEAWRLVGLLTSGEESDPQDKVKLISDLATMNASEADTRIAAIKLLNVVGKVTQENIALIEQNQIEKDYLRFLGVEDEDDDAALIKLAIELVAGKHFDFFQQLIEKGDMHAADHLTSIVIDHLPEIDDKKLARNMDIDVVYSYVDFATENDTYYYYLENTVLVLEKHDKNRLQEWAKSQLQKSRHRWSNQRSISDTANYVDMFRKIVRGEL